MTEKEIKITFPEAKLEALTFFLMEQNEKSVEELLKGSLDKLYEKNVPVAVRKFVERDQTMETSQETLLTEQETQSERVARQPRTTWVEEAELYSHRKKRHSSRHRKRQKRWRKIL